MNHQQRIDLLHIGKFLLALIIILALTTHIYQSNNQDIWLLDYMIPNKTAARVTGALLLFYAFKLCLGTDNFLTRIIGNIFALIRMLGKNN